MDTFFHRLVFLFFIALGVVLGASLIGSLAAVLIGQPPIRTMARLAQEIKIWAVASALGGTFATLEILGQGLFGGETPAVIKQLLYLSSAFLGAQTGYYLIITLAGGR